MSLDSDIEAKLLHTEWNELEKDGWKLMSFIPDSNYIVAVIIDSNIENTIHFNWNHDIFL